MPHWWSEEALKILSRNMQIAIVKRAESENLNISKIQNGGRPPYWKSKARKSPLPGGR